MIVLNKTLEHLSWSELQTYWLELAVFLQGKMDPQTRKLPPLYESAYARCRDEFALRGFQMQLF